MSGVTKTCLVIEINVHSQWRIRAHATTFVSTNLKTSTQCHAGGNRTTPQEAEHSRLSTGF